MLALNELQGHPHRRFPTVHVAGTNGKGSVTTKIAKGLQSRFAKVGLFTSPHIASFRERIRINGQMISEEEVAPLLDDILALSEQNNIPATFFEVTTQLAFQHFAKHKVDIAVLETGLGGRLDATNVVGPALTIITSLHLDHTEILGTTLEEIAREKGGILKPGVPTILGPSACCLRSAAPGPVLAVTGGHSDYIAENNAIARKALQFFDIPQPAIEAALTSQPPCRMEKLRYEGQEVILDVAHNPEGLRRLFEVLATPAQHVRVLCGLSKTKDHKGCLKVIGEGAEHIHLVDAPNGRCAPPHILANILETEGRSSEDYSVHSSVAPGLECALKAARQKGQKTLVCGTFFIMGVVRKLLGIGEPQDPLDMNEHLRS